MGADVSGVIWWLRCSTCGAEFPTFVFSGENDCVTAEWRTKTNLETKTLYVYNHSDAEPDGDDVELIKAEQVLHHPRESFQAYRERSKHSEGRYIYKCASCSDGHAEKVSQVSVDQLQLKGYKYIDLLKRKIKDTSPVSVRRKNC